MADALKDKFEHLAYTKQPTPHPHIPFILRRKKQISRDTNAKARAIVLEDHDENPAPSKK